MSKIIVPKHVEGGMFDMGIDIGPFRVKMWQLFIIAIGFAIFFGIMNGLKKGGLGMLPAAMIASPVMILTLMIAFFRKSELYIIGFITKLIRTYIIGSPKSFQRNVIKPADWEVKLQFSKLNKGDEKNIEQKELEKDDLDKNIDVLSKF